MSQFATTIQRQLKHDVPYAWFMRDKASTSPVFRRQDLAQLDARLDSYLNCVLLSQYGEQSLLAKLNPLDWGTVFVTAVIALRSRDSGVFKHAVAILKDPQQAHELSDALCRVDYQTAKPFLEQLVVHDNPWVRAAAISSMDCFKINIDVDLLHGFLNDLPFVIAAALKLIGNNKLFTYKDTVSALLEHDIDSVRFQAAYAGILLGVPAALPVLQSFCFNETPHLHAALGLLYHVVHESDIMDSLMRIQKSPFSPRIKAYNIAMAGLPEKIPILIEWMNDPEYAPVAGEAFGFISGVDIEDDGLSVANIELCESQEAPLAVKRKKDPWTRSYEADLPWPDPELVKAWWQANQHRFQSESRYLAGHTLAETHLQHVLMGGTQPQRQAASLVLAIKNPQLTVVDVTRCLTIPEKI